MLSLNILWPFLEHLFTFPHPLTHSHYQRNQPSSWKGHTGVREWPVKRFNAVSCIPSKLWNIQCVWLLAGSGLGMQEASFILYAHRKACWKAVVSIYVMKPGEQISWSSALYRCTHCNGLAHFIVYTLSTDFQVPELCLPLWCYADCSKASGSRSLVWKHLLPSQQTNLCILPWQGTQLW